MIRSPNNCAFSQQSRLLYFACKPVIHTLTTRPKPTRPADVGYPSLLTRLWRYAVLFVRQPKQIASLAPSSSYLAGQVARLSCLQNAKRVVELGPGDGSITIELLQAISPSCKLLAIELLPDLVEILHSINDPRLLVEHGDATNLDRLAQQHHFQDVDVVVSGIPFSNLDRDQATEILDKVYESLAPGGTFIAYQVRDEINELAFNRFGQPDTKWIPWNIPPVNLSVWVKQEQTNQEYNADFVDVDSEAIEVCVADNVDLMAASSA